MTSAHLDAFGSRSDVAGTMHLRLTGRSSSHFTRVVRILAYELAAPLTFDVLGDVMSIAPVDYVVLIRLDEAAGLNRSEPTVYRRSIGDSLEAQAKSLADAAKALGHDVRVVPATLAPIVQQDRDGTTLRRWSLSRAWPTKFVAGERDNENDENVIESVTLTYDFFELAQ